MEKGIKSFLGILNYLSKFSPMTDEVSEPLWKLTSVKTEWSRNGMYQGIYNKAKYLFRQYICMKFYGALKPLNLETDSVNLGAGLLQVRDGMNCGHDEIPENAILHPTAFISKSLSHAK